MTALEIQKIRAIQSILQSIDKGVNVFFNVANYEKLGLITTKKKYTVNSAGNKVVIGFSFHLTEKSKRYLNIVL